MGTATFKTACLLALATTLASPLAATKGDVDQVMGRGGLEQVKVKDLDLAYVKPGASLATYKRIKLEPAEVEFSKNWNPQRTGSNLKMSQADREKIRVKLAEIVRDEFARGLQAGGAYQVATETGPDVLLVKPRLLNVYLNAPDAGMSARSRTYVSNAGEMTLMAELHDSTSGQVVARIADRREATSSGTRLATTNNMVNESDARQIASEWARILRKSLDKAHAIGS